MTGPLNVGGQISIGASGCTTVLRSVAEGFEHLPIVHQRFRVAPAELKDIRSGVFGATGGFLVFTFGEDFGLSDGSTEPSASART